MKKTIILLAALAMALGLVGCQDASKVDESNLQKESQVDNTIEKDSNALSQEELDWFETSFFNQDEDWMSNMFLSSEYETSADIDLSNLFYGGANGKGGIGEVTEEEVQLLLDSYNIEKLDVSKATVDEMNAVLQKYVGLTLDETNKVDIQALYYLEEYNAYYNVAGDTEYIKCDILDGWINEDGTITLRYADALSDPASTYEVTLKDVDGNYYFVSNKCID